MLRKIIIIRQKWSPSWFSHQFLCLLFSNWKRMSQQVCTMATRSIRKGSSWIWSPMMLSCQSITNHCVQCAVAPCKAGTTRFSKAGAVSQLLNYPRILARNPIINWQSPMAHTSSVPAARHLLILRRPRSPRRDRLVAHETCALWTMLRREFLNGLKIKRCLTRHQTQI